MAKKTHATGKSAAKKAPPKKKLIEGKYSHKFLTRLEPGSGDKLEKLLSLLNIKTYNGTVVFMIHSFSNMIEQIKSLQSEVDMLKTENYRIKSDVRVVVNGLNNLQKIK